MSTHNICFRREIRKIICGYPLLSVAMIQTFILLQAVNHCISAINKNDIFTSERI